MRSTTASCIDTSKGTISVMAPSGASVPALFNSSRVDDVDRRASRIGDDLLEDVCELEFILVASHIADMRRANDVVHRNQRIVRVEQRLFLEHVDCGHA